MNKIDSISFGGLGTSNNVNIHNITGIIDKYNIDELDSLTFKNIEGRVAADINIIDHNNTSVKFDITRTASCEGFKLMLMDYNSIISLGTNDLVYYLENNAGESYYQDFEDVEIKDLDLLPNTEYAVVTVGIDKYGLLCDVLWSDPAEINEEFGDSDRGISVTFSKKVISRFLNENQIDLICRAHQVVEDGYEFFANQKLVTVFSAPNYCEMFDNSGAIMVVNENLQCSFKILKCQNPNSIPFFNENLL
jgi:hypothetical protein